MRFNNTQKKKVNQGNNLMLLIKAGLFGFNTVAFKLSSLEKHHSLQLLPFVQNTKSCFAAALLTGPLKLLPV